MSRIRGTSNTPRIRTTQQPVPECATRRQVRERAVRLRKQRRMGGGCGGVQVQRLLQPFMSANGATVLQQHIKRRARVLLQRVGAITQVGNNVIYHMAIKAEDRNKDNNTMSPMPMF